MDTEAISQHFDECACARQQRGRPGFIRGSSKSLLALLDGHIDGRTVLDVGCGAGGLTVEAVSRGARRATGIDLSALAIREARTFAAHTAIADRLTYMIGDASSTPLPRHDVVVLDKVICCYPEPDSLLNNSLPAARQTYAVVVPFSSGPRGVLAKAGIWLENAGRRIRRRPFRAFVHDIKMIEARIAAAGLQRAADRSHVVWYLAVYVRPGHSQ
jgi:SAM-dependent methyltransferase